MRARIGAVTASLARRSLAVVLVSLSALCCAAGSHPAQPPREPGREEWLELETPHFSIYTDLTELPARHMAQSLEDARAALLAGAWPGAKGPPGRTRIVAFARPADFDRLSGVGAQFEGVAFAVPGFERWIAFSPGRDTGVPRVVTHELVHDLSHWFLPLQPPWLAEGLAGYLEGARLDYETRDVTVGEVPTGYVNWLKRSGTLMSSSRLFAATAQHSDDVRDGVAFYAGSWYLVFYLLQRHGEAFAAFQRHLLHLVPWRRAWNLAFPELTSEQLDTDMIDFAKTGPFTPVVEAFDRPVFEPEVRRLTPARAHGIRGLLGTLLYVDAGAEIEAAVKLDPAEPSALTAWFHLLPETDSRGRRDIARRAVAGHPDSGEAWLLSARVATEADERRHALERADELMPHHPGVAALLAADELGRGRAARALELVRFAERRSGLSGEVLAVHIRALVALGRCADAAQLVDSSVALLPPTCEDFDAKSASTVNCIQAVRAAYDPNAGSCAAATRSAEVTPPENDAASSR